MMVLTLAQNIDNLESLLPAVKKVGAVYVAANVKPEHYPIVVENLLGAIKQVLGDGANEEVLKAWEEAYGVISSIFIYAEKDIYSQK